MKKGLLITNAFLVSEKFDQIYELLTEAAGRHDTKLIHRTNADFMPVYSKNGIFLSCREASPPTAKSFDFILFWDKDVRLARAFEAAGLPVFNSASAIEACDDKALTLEKLAGAGLTEGKKPEIRLPLTVMAPMTFSGIGYTDLSFIMDEEETISYPMVIKECFGSFGAQVHLAKNRKGRAQPAHHGRIHILGGHLEHLLQHRGPGQSQYDPQCNMFFPLRHLQVLHNLPILSCYYTTHPAPVPYPPGIKRRHHRTLNFFRRIAAAASHRLSRAGVCRRESRRDD